MNTLDKINQLVAEVRKMNPREADESTRGLIEMLQIMTGLGFDPLSMLLPDSPADADQMVDSLIALLFHVRGDDLPPFDLQRHVTEATATDAD